MGEAQSLLMPEHELPPDVALEIVSENLAAADMPGEAMALAGKMKDADLRTDAIHNVIQATARLHDAATCRKLLEPLKEPRERAAGLIGIADGLLDEASVETGGGKG